MARFKLEIEFDTDENLGAQDHERDKIAQHLALQLAHVTTAIHAWEHTGSIFDAYGKQIGKWILLDEAQYAIYLQDREFIESVIGA